MLSSGEVPETAQWLTKSYPMSGMGRRAERGNGTRIRVGRSYKITYRDHNTVKTERITDVQKRGRKYITAYCHLRNATRAFKRSRIKSIEPV